MKPRIVFMGSPAFSVPALQDLTSKYQVIGVVTQPDRPSGRGQKMTSSAVKSAAQEHNIPFIQPRRLREPDAMEQLRTWNPDLFVVAAFGQILRQEVLDLPHLGCLNIHASLLPRWRGAAPIQAAILNGDVETGITIMKMDAGVDTGPILQQQSTAIFPLDTAGTLGQRLSLLGAKLLMQNLPMYLEGKLTPIPQDETKVTLAPMLSKKDACLDLTKPATQLMNQIRAMDPWPGTYLVWRGQHLKIHSAQPSTYLEKGQNEQNVFPGKQIILGGFPGAITGDGIILFTEVQPAGKKRMSGKDFLLGNRDWDH